MNVQRVQAWIDLVAEAGIAELTVTEAEFEVHIVRRVAAARVPEPAGLAPTDLPPAPAGASAIVAAGVHVVRAPMVGTFHRSARAGAPPLADVGTRVEVGSPLGVIEAMKVMNEVESDRAGTVTRVLCAAGQAVEPGQALFEIG